MGLGGQMQQAQAAGVPPPVTGSGTGAGPVPDSILGEAQALQNTTQLTGFASCLRIKITVGTMTDITLKERWFDLDKKDIVLKKAK
jgi:hypothetical protein